MKPLTTWEPCLADMNRGVAFFDGITIEADRITDPRWERVLPILEEEQVFMCRMMDPSLREHSGAWVLDIGTGSGVFAIYAAKRGCRVVAIDISARALRFARQNARTNKIPITETEPAPGEVQFLNCSYKEMLEDGKFDFVIIAPPYNPTCEEFHPALHAEAGPLGQQCFEEQLPHVARLLKSDGTCIGNQMMVVNRAGDFDVKPLLQRHFSGWEFNYLRILPKDILVDDFLNGQYASYLNPDMNSNVDQQFQIWKCKTTSYQLIPAINFIAYRFPLPQKKWLFGEINRNIKMKYN